MQPRTHLLTAKYHTVIKPEFWGFSVEKATRVLTSFVLNEKHSNMRAISVPPLP